ncbi:HNH endonuclease [Pleurocapsales cyanobacterium LEGE 10410]|nr:HNH endonuclease [Pleurocapsales cyanobacterium LEGE 10410]
MWRLSPEGGIRFVKQQLEILHHKCPVCHNPLTEKSATVDHLRPKSKYLGMAVDENNMLILCHSCNAAKNNQEFEDWYSKLPLVWQERIDKAITEIHGTIKLLELVPSKKIIQK